MRVGYAVLSAFLALSIFVSAITSILAEEPQLLDIKAYSATIALVQADLDAGKYSAAREKLESTNEQLRSFEYHYLLARANAASDETSAPDLIQVVKTPDVPTRYGILDETNRQLVFICQDSSIRVHNLNDTEAEPKTLTHEGGGAVWSGAFSADGSTFAAGFEDGEVVIWNASDWETRSTLRISENTPVRELRRPDGNAIVAEGKSALELWSFADDLPKKVADVGERLNFGEGLAYSPKGDLIATGGMFDITLVNARTGETERKIRHASYTMGIAFSPDGKQIASAPRANVNKFLAVFDLSNGEMLFNAGPFPCYIHGGIFTPDGQRILSLACEKVPYMQLYDASTGELVYSLARTETGTTPGFSKDGKLLGWFERDGYRYIDLN